MIPCFNEPNVLQSIKSVWNAEEINGSIEIIVVINHGESDTHRCKEQNKISSKQIADWIKNNSAKDKSCFIINAFDLPDKNAGVGIARKIGMDEAVRRFEVIDNPNGIIVCFDADSSCTTNYLSEIEKSFTNNPKMQGGSIHYEHPLDGDKFSNKVYANILQYELHLRYYIEMQHFLMVPYAYHTVGSSMAVRAEAYTKVGGMNQRKAGEDFYFIHKLIKSFEYGNILDTKVIPSPRESDRVPFGTGRAVSEMIADNTSEYLTYHPQSFYDLDEFFNQLPEIYDTEEHEELDVVVQRFLDSLDYLSRIKEIKGNTSNYSNFYKRFYRWFDAFVLMKYLHYRREIDFPDIPVSQAIDIHLCQLRHFGDIDKLKQMRLMEINRELV